MNVRGETRAGICGIVGYALSTGFAAVGSLLIPPLVALLAIVAVPLDREFWRFREFPWALAGALAFLAWALLSFLWSPYDNPEQILKTGFGIPLYILFAVRMGQLGNGWRRRVEAMMIFMVVTLGLILLSEALMGGYVTRSFKMLDPFFAEMTRADVDEFVFRNLGHAAVPLILMSVPVSLIAWRAGGPVIGVVVMIFAAIAAFSFRTEVNAAAFLLASVAAGLAMVWPRAMVVFVFGASAGLVLVLPLIAPALIEVVPDGLRQALPDSWDYRLDIWAFVGERIREQPWFGYGFNASRPLNDELFIVVGDTVHNVEALPLHPHNATLQIWLETGAVGAGLLAGTLIALGGRIAGAIQLSRLQAVGAVWVLVVYVALIVFSYGVWQEWHQGTVALAAASVLFLGARKPVR